MTPTTLNDFIGRLAEIGLVAQSQALRVHVLSQRAKLIEVGDTSANDTFYASYENSLQHYIDTFNDGHYSLLMTDGAMISLKYHWLRSEEIGWHRYVFMPPVVTLDVLAGEGPGDLPEPAQYQLTPRRALLRFEFDPDQTEERHPASHLHLNSPNCRVPVSSRLGVFEFMSFIVDNFYPDHLADFAAASPARAAYRDDLSENDRRRFSIRAPVI